MRETAIESTWLTQCTPFPTAFPSQRFARQSRAAISRTRAMSGASSTTSIEPFRKHMSESRASHAHADRERLRLSANALRNRGEPRISPEIESRLAVRIGRRVSTARLRTSGGAWPPDLAIDNDLSFIIRISVTSADAPSGPQNHKHRALHNCEPIPGACTARLLVLAA